MIMAKLFIFSFFSVSLANIIIFERFLYVLKFVPQFQVLFKNTKIKKKKVWLINLTLLLPTVYAKSSEV